MANVSQKVSARLSTALRRFQPIIASAKARDVGESDTVIIVTDLLSELFGYDKYAEITSETAIRGTYCDLAVKLDGAIQALNEVKAIGCHPAAPLQSLVDSPFPFHASRGCGRWYVIRIARVEQVQDVALKVVCNEFGHVPTHAIPQASLVAQTYWIAG